MPRALMRMLVGRVAAAAALIAVAFGAGVYYFESERIDEMVVELAMTEARAFAELHGAAFTQAPSVLEERLDGFLDQREAGSEGHFVIAEIYDAGRVALGEATRGDVTAIERALDERAHPFPADDRAHYDKLTIDRSLYVRVVTPLTAPGFTGFFEGVFQVSDQRVEYIEELMVTAVAIAVATVLGSTLFLLPIIIGLNRHLLRLSNRLLLANVEMLEVLGGAIAKRDSDTDQHNYRVSIYAVRLAEAMGLSADEIRALVKGAFLHDVGKIAIPDAILLKPGKLTEDEFAVMKTHVSHGLDIVRQSEWLADAARVVGGHHEKFAGGGYPAGTRGEDIPLGARVFAVVDVFDALTSKRPYKEPMPLEKAMAIIADGVGAHFDPAVHRHFVPLAGDWYREVAGLDTPALREIMVRIVGAYFIAA